MIKKSVKTLKKYTPPTGERKGKLRLDFNENTIGCSEKVIKALRNISKEDICTYPEYNKFRNRLATYLNLKTENIIPTNGADEAIKVTIDTYIEKGDEIIIPKPTFAMFKIYSQIAGAKITSILYNKDLSFPTDKLLKTINQDTKLVILVNPNNPTGTAINGIDIIKIIEKAKDSIVLIDEAYYQFYEESSKELIKKYNNVIIIQTFSKAFGLAGLRLGYIISNKDIIRNLDKVVSPYSVNSLAIIAANAALEDIDFIKSYTNEIKESKKYLKEELEKLGITTFPSEANFIIANLGNNCNRTYNELKERNILVRNRTDYPLLKNCLRISIGTTEQCQRLINELRNILKKETLLFDMDGVLIDVSQSYILAIKKTAEFFLNKEVTINEIETVKSESGYNNEWDMTEKIILKRNLKIKKQDIINRYQQYYLSLRDNEKLLISKETLKKLRKSFRLGIVTGRPKKEAEYTLKINNIEKFFDIIIAMEDCKPKPSPDGINLALKLLNSNKATYFGDNVDDELAAKNAEIKFIGVSNPSLKTGTGTFLKDINQIMEVIR